MRLFIWYNQVNKQKTLCTKHRSLVWCKWIRIYNFLDVFSNCLLPCDKRMTGKKKDKKWAEFTPLCYLTQNLQFDNLNSNDSSNTTALFTTNMFSLLFSSLPPEINTKSFLFSSSLPFCSTEIKMKMGFDFSDKIL